MARIAFYEFEPWMETYLKDKLPNHTLTFIPHALNNKTVSKAKKADILTIFIHFKSKQRNNMRIAQYKNDCYRFNRI